MDRRSSTVSRRLAAATRAVGAARARSRVKAADPDSTRAAILDAALDLFVERGFHGTAVPLVAERAGIAAGTIYRHFESKEALVNALYRGWKERITGDVLRDFPLTATPRDHFHAAWIGVTAFIAEHPRAYAFLELHHHAPYLDEASRAVERRTYEFAGVVIARGQASGVIRSGLRPCCSACCTVPSSASFASGARAESLGPPKSSSSPKRRAGISSARVDLRAPDRLPSITSCSLCE